MVNLKSLLPALVLALPGAAAAQTCLTSNAGFQNAAFAARTAPFELTFDAKPGAAKIDGVTGFSAAPATGFAGMAAIVRFNTQGLIDARDGGSYRAAQSVPYAAGATYRFQVRIDPVAKRYSVYVAPPGGSLRTLASNFAFRTEQARSSSIGYWSLSATAGSHQVCNMTLAGAATADTTAPTVSLTAPAAGTTVSGVVAVSASAADDRGVAGVQFKLDGANLGAEDTSAPYSVAWDGSKAADGAHSLTAVARDAAGNRATSAAVSVTVQKPAACRDSGAAWQNASFPAQSAPFSATFTAKPSAAKIDGVTGLSVAAASGFTSLAAIVRFNTAGAIDARDGGAYAADALIPYAAGATYRFRLSVDPGARRYSVYVTPPGSSERTLADGFAFRSEQRAVTRLANWGLASTSGSHQVCDLVVSSLGAAADTSPPKAAVTAPSAGATVFGVVSVSASASDDKGVAGVQFKLDGADLGAEDTASPYSAAWDTTKSADGAHTLTAVARDAAGNKTTSASVSVTVKNGVAVGTGGGASSVRQLYPNAPGGKVWYSKWDNGVARTFGWGVDPADAWFRGKGDATYKVDGKGLLKVSGPVPRMYVVDPALLSSWRNVEMTVYAMRVSDSNTAYGGIVGVARTNHGMVGGSETTNRCDSRGLGARFRYDGHLDLEKETSHPNSFPVKNKTHWAGGLPKNRWIGWKLAIYDLANGNVKVESWMDDGETGNWVKVNEIEDTGSNWGVGGVACKSGIDPAMRLRAGDSRAGSESGKPNISAYFRTDNVGTDGIIYKKMSVREIQP